MCRLISVCKCMHVLCACMCTHVLACAPSYVMYPAYVCVPSYVMCAACVCTCTPTCIYIYIYICVCVHVRRASPGIQERSSPPQEAPQAHWLALPHKCLLPPQDFIELSESRCKSHFFTCNRLTDNYIQCHPGHSCPANCLALVLAASLDAPVFNRSTTSLAISLSCACDFSARLPPKLNN